MKNIFQNKRLLTFDTLVNLVVFVYPLTAFPQLYNIYILKEVAGVSLIMWVGFLLVSLILLMHVIRNKDKKLTMMYSSWIIIYLTVIFGLLIY